MSKGPKLNNIDKNFTTRDNLGIENVAVSFQRQLCPVVNTVTPRAFYWIFMTWNYYDFYTNSGIKQWKYDAFDKPFLKKNDYYFVLSNLLTHNSDQNDMAGKDNTSKDTLKNPNGPYKYNDEYFVAGFGGMQYYNAGCLTLGFITDRNEDGEVYKLPRLTEQLGKPLAKAFEDVIKDTKYYQEYRLKNAEVPKEVLLEFGSKVSLKLDGFDECKKLLRNALFEPKQNVNLDNKNLIKSSEYLKFIYNFYNIKNPDLKEIRKVIFDYFSPRGEYKYSYDSNLDEIIKQWELVAGRQYFVIAIELIWKYMLTILNTPKKLDEWISTSIQSSNWNIDVNKNLEEYLNECNFTFEQREEMIARGYRLSKKVDSNIENGIKILLSIYNRFIDRNDINSEYLEYGDEISIANLIRLVDEYKNKPLYKFIGYIMKKWIIEAHEITALNKLGNGRNGYYFENVDGLYIRKAIPEPDFPGIRLIQLLQVMKDLDMLEE